MRTWAEIDLNAISTNVKQFKKCLNNSTKLMVVVKADGYGHGALEVSKCAVKSGADYLAVAACSEAVNLRENNIKTPILILGAVFNEDIPLLIKYDITPTVVDYEFAKELSNEAVNKNKMAKIHIKLDTGMSRIGYRCENDTYIEECIKISKLPNIVIEGIFSHFSKADEHDETYTHLQYNTFCKMCEILENNGINIPIKHICNSAGIIKYPQYHLDMVRLGISLYGHYPSTEFNENDIELTPAMTFKTKIVYIKDVPKDTYVGYGGAYKTDESKKIATLAVGYADGYPRTLSNKAYVTVKGKRCKVIGNVCMDQMMIDVTGLDNLKIGDEVILFGKSGNNNVTVEEIAALIGTINYEILCNLSKRVLRIYIQ